MIASQLLERITLDSQVMLFSRMCATSAIYYHWHQCVELLYISRGYGIVVVDNQHYTARPGRLFIFPPFRLHKVQVESSERDPYHRTAMHVEQSAVETALSAFPRHQRQFVALAASDIPAQIYDLSEHADDMELILGQFASLGDDERDTACEVAFLMMQIMAHLPAQPACATQPEQTEAARIMRWLEAHLAEKFSLTNLAGAIGLSRSHTSRLFHQQTGGGIQEYLLTRRIKRSCDLLRITPRRIDDIAKAVGFSDATYFITCFKKMMGKTPLQYRKSFQGRQGTAQEDVAIKGI